MTRSAHPAIARPVLVALALCLGLTGCGTATMEDAVPVSSVTGLPTGPVDTGTYPNLNVPPASAAPQLTPSESQQLSGELSARKAAQQAQAVAPPATTAAELAALRQRHAEEALKTIEGDKPAE